MKLIFQTKNFLKKLHNANIRIKLVLVSRLLTHQTPKLPLYRNQSIDLFSKSVDWFLYDDNFGF